MWIVCDGIGFLGMEIRFLRTMPLDRTLAIWKCNLNESRNPFQFSGWPGSPWWTHCLLAFIVLKVLIQTFIPTWHSLQPNYKINHRNTRLGCCSYFMCGLEWSASETHSQAMNRLMRARLTGSHVWLHIKLCRFTSCMQMCVTMFCSERHI